MNVMYQWKEQKEAGGVSILARFIPVTGLKSFGS